MCVCSYTSASSYTFHLDLKQENKDILGYQMIKLLFKWNLGQTYTQYLKKVTKLGEGEKKNDSIKHMGLTRTKFTEY